MRNLDSELAYFRIEIGRRFAKEVNELLPIPEGAIRTAVEQGPFKLSQEEQEEVVRELGKPLHSHPKERLGGYQ